MDTDNTKLDFRKSQNSASLLSLFRVFSPPCTIFKTLCNSILTFMFSFLHVKLMYMLSSIETFLRQYIVKMFTHRLTIFDRIRWIHFCMFFHLYFDNILSTRRLLSNYLWPNIKNTRHNMSTNWFTTDMEL